jgi:peptidoglycan/xylan/chitin deacetylase (PgdA/CDA1 family)
MTEKTPSHRSTASAPWGRFALLCVAVILLAALALFLAPTGHLNTRNLVQVNGITYSVPGGMRVADLSDLSALLARSGSSLDLTGDVIALGAGSAAERLLDDEPLSQDLVLTDGTVLVVRHGQHLLEGIKRTTETVAHKTTVEGDGPVVSLVQTGEDGEREIYKGVSSGKQAAALFLRPPEDAVLRRSTAAGPGQKLAALTFDDGPGKHTQAVLDALAAKHVPATFFVLGGSAAGNKEMIAKIKAAGHEVENHTWNHPILTQVTEQEFRNQISRTNNVIGGSRFLRPPYGIYNSTVAAWAKDMGLRLVLWTVDTLDWKYPDVDSILSYVKAQTKPGAVILMHDGGNNRSTTVAAIPVVVDWLFEQGYSLTTVDHIF